MKLGENINLTERNADATEIILKRAIPAPFLLNFLMLFTESIELVRFMTQYNYHNL